MDLKDFAKRINKKEYTGSDFLTPEEIQEAKDNNFVVVTGASDDLLELNGCIYDEVGVFDGGQVYIQLPKYDCRCKDNITYETKISTADDFEYDDQYISICIDARWCEDVDENGQTIAWSYDLEDEDIPVATFDLMENDEVYCRGIVFSLDDIYDNIELFQNHANDEDEKSYFLDEGSENTENDMDEY